MKFYIKIDDITKIILSGLDGIIGNRDVALDQIKRSILLQLHGKVITLEEAHSLRKIIAQKFMEALPDHGAPVGIRASTNVMSKVLQDILSAHRSAGNQTAVGLNSLKRILTSRPPTIEVTYVTLKGYKGPNELYDFALRHMNPRISVFIDNTTSYPFEFINGDIDIKGNTIRVLDKRKVDVQIVKYINTSRVAKIHLNRNTLMRYRVSLDSIAEAITLKFDICVGIGSLEDCNIYLYGGVTIVAFETFLMLNYREIMNIHVYNANVSSKGTKTNYGTRLAKHHEYSEFTLKQINILPTFKMINGDVLTLDIAYMQFIMISMRRIKDIVKHYGMKLKRINDFDHKIIGGVLDMDMLKSASIDIMYKHVIIFYGAPLGLYYLLNQPEVLKSETYCNNPQVMQVLFGIECAHMMQACSAVEATVSGEIHSEDLKLVVAFTSGCGKLVNVVDKLGYDSLGNASRSEASKSIFAGAISGQDVPIPVLGVSVMLGAKPAMSTYEVETRNIEGTYSSNTGLRDVDGIGKAIYHEL